MVESWQCKQAFSPNICFSFTHVSLPTQAAIAQPFVIVAMTPTVPKQVELHQHVKRRKPQHDHDTIAAATALPLLVQTPGLAPRVTSQVVPASGN